MSLANLPLVYPFNIFLLGLRPAGPLALPKRLKRSRALILLGAIALGVLLGGQSGAIAAENSASDPGPWVIVARSEAGAQYVAPSSVQPTASGVRLKSYWQHPGADGTPETVYYLTEYDCKGRYRDVEATGQAIEATGQAKDKNWKSIGSDSLNRGAMEYGCARRGSN